MGPKFLVISNQLRKEGREYSKLNPRKVKEKDVKDSGMRMWVS